MAQQASNLKLSNSTARLWQRSGKLCRFIGLGLVTIGLGNLIWIIADPSSAQVTSSWQSAEGSRASTRPSTRPHLVDAIAHRPIRQALAEAQAAAPAQAETHDSGPPPPPPPPQVEIVATFTSPGSPPQAYIKRKDGKSLITWSIGSQEGQYRVSQITDGQVVLEGSGTMHVLKVPRRGR